MHTPIENLDVNNNFGWIYYTTKVNCNETSLIKGITRGMVNCLQNNYLIFYFRKSFRSLNERKLLLSYFYLFSHKRAKSKIYFSLQLQQVFFTFEFLISFCLDFSIDLKDFFIELEKVLLDILKGT